MPKTDEWSDLAREIAEAQRERGPRNRFDERLRGRVVAAVQKRIAAGDSITALIRELGLGRNTLTEWLARSPTRGNSTTATTALVPVVIGPSRHEPSFVLELGGGRIKGLKLDDIAELVRRLA